ncbi:TetR/AcrR family transcriptional regulator [Antrihabitans cavernicola]|uniref:TetR/AcrR family transcriptional regulator n=1 Tax=Antrihabitans cavernicola TaxID=2495913 RepID=A0A5A7SK61_9NOCA|nr:TetR/AcrR family transcriptional regulator [Spelaeibacter cavernicola]KAA0024845.1 TetR/AcrR family transcriptional regulator [Spelaeibacter cavernicola]
MEVNRRTQAERSADTRAALVAAGRRLFTEHGFGGVGTQTIGKEAGVSRGALYHQFADKTELFAAVFEDVEESVIERIGQIVGEADITGPLDAMEIGAHAWLDVCAEPEVHRIVLIEAPSVLGWERWRESGLKYGLGLIEGLLTGAMAEGLIPEQPIRPLAHVIGAMVDEAALYVARADDAEAARKEMYAITTRFLQALTTP